MSEKQFYTAKELADVLGYNIMTIYRYIKAGNLSAFKVGKEFRVKKEDFDIFINSKRK